MANIEKYDQIAQSIEAEGGDILDSANMQREKLYTHHSTVNCYQHSLSVAYMSAYLARAARLKVDERSLIRGALLHDYFLYDWREADQTRRLHGLHHARLALRNAHRDFHLNQVEADIIVKHMFPLNIRPPRYRESVIVSVADKICAVCELCAFRPRMLGYEKKKGRAA